MALKSLFLFITISCLITSNASAARVLVAPLGHIDDLAARIKASGGLVECWNALYELKSCTNEIVVFLINGQADIGPECCGAIHIVTGNCWPAMLTSLGFTPEEGNLLIGYCHAPEPATSGPAPGPLAESPADLTVVG